MAGIYDCEKGIPDIPHDTNLASFLVLKMDEVGQEPRNLAAFRG